MIHNFTLRARAESGARARSGADRKRTRSATLLRTLNRFSPMDLEQSWKNGIHIPVLRSRNYLFSAPAPPLSIISAPAPAPAIYCNLKLYYNANSSTYQTKYVSMEIFLYTSILQTDSSKYLLKR